MVDMSQLDPLESALLDYVTSDKEPTWIMLHEIPETGGDRARTEVALRKLEAQGLLTCTQEESGNPDLDYLSAVDDWWALTAAGWEVVGETPPLNYP